MEVIKKEHFVPICGARDNTNLPLCVTGGKHASSICRNACADVLPGLFCGCHNSFGYAHHLNALKASSSTAGEEWKRCYCRTCASLFFCKRGTFSKMEVNVPKWEEFRAAKWMCVCGWVEVSGRACCLHDVEFIFILKEILKQLAGYWFTTTWWVLWFL